MVIKDVLYNSHNHWVGSSYIDNNAWIIYSDYGTYSAAFSFGSRTMKEFLNGCNSDYLCRKMLEKRDRQVINWEKTVKELKKQILESRRENIITRQEARDYFDAFLYLDGEEKEYQFHPDSYPEWYEHIVYDESSESICLKKYVLEPFLGMFKKQMEENN